MLRRKSAAASINVRSAGRMAELSSSLGLETCGFAAPVVARLPRRCTGRRRTHDSFGSFRSSQAIQRTIRWSLRPKALAIYGCRIAQGSPCRRLVWPSGAVERKLKILVDVGRSRSPRRSGSERDTFHPSAGSPHRCEAGARRQQRVITGFAAAGWISGIFDSSNASAASRLAGSSVQAGLEILRMKALRSGFSFSQLRRAATMPPW